MPRKQAAEKASRVQEREALALQAKNRSYKLLSDEDEEDVVPVKVR